MKIFKYTGHIKLLTGLHIGAGDDTMQIGGIDNSVIKHANTQLPYIPGSSLKGKMRSLLEWHYALVGISNGEPFSPKFLNNVKFENKTDETNALNLMRLFGTNLTKEDLKVLEEKDLSLGITRLSVGDSFLSLQDKQRYEDESIKLTEAKYENTIDRSSGIAKHPRQVERVVEGVCFDFDIRLKVFTENEEKALKAMLEKGLELVENDYLGGNGSRGYGRVSFENGVWS